MNPSLTALIVAGVAGTFGLGGALLAANRDHERWLRQTRLETYSNFVSAVRDLDRHMQSDRLRRLRPQAWAERPSDWPGRPEKENVERFAVHYEEMLHGFEKMEPLDTGLARVLLVGPAALDDSARDVHRHASNLLNAPEFDRGDLEAALSQFTTLARSQLLKERARLLRRG